MDATSRKKKGGQAPYQSRIRSTASRLSARSAVDECHRHSPPSSEGAYLYLKPPLCKGRWIFAEQKDGGVEKPTAIAQVTLIDVSFCRQPLSLLRRQPPLHRGAYLYLKPSPWGEGGPQGRMRGEIRPTLISRFQRQLSRLSARSAVDECHRHSPPPPEGEAFCFLKLSTPRGFPQRQQNVKIGPKGGKTAWLRQKTDFLKRKTCL